MDQSRSWKTNNRPASQKIPGLLWNPKVHYRVHKSLPLVPFLNYCVTFLRLHGHHEDGCSMSETTVSIHHITRRNNLENHEFPLHCRDNLKSQRIYKLEHSIQSTPCPTFVGLNSALEGLKMAALLL
jgi:hypothetical protein